MATRCLLALVSAFLLGAFDDAWAAGAEAPFDAFGGIKNVAGQRSGNFHLEKIGRRWWVVTPAGHGIFIRAVSKVDTADYGGSGGFLSYDGVYLENAAGIMSSNLAAAAEDTLPRDVIHPVSGVTLKSEGDALYLGSSRFQPNFVYFWLDQLGQGGKLQWYYSTGYGWSLVQHTGKPRQGAALPSDGSWNLESGYAVAPDEDGFGRQQNSKANKIIYWSMAEGFPADFAPVTLPNDPVRRYYLKAVVQRSYSRAPILNQTYERAELEEAIARKYSPGDVFGKWAEAMTQRLVLWGFNAAGQYSSRYAAKVAGRPGRLPVEHQWRLGDWAMRWDGPFRVKNVYAGAVFPPGSRNLLYQGLQPDVFEPRFEKAYRELVAQQGALRDPWAWALIPEEADFLFGLNSLTHDHLGYVVLAQNPCQRRASPDGQEVVYEDPRLFAKYALRDFLRDRYRTFEDTAGHLTANSATPCYAYSLEPTATELGALSRLNTAWGTHYSTWDTSSGNVLKGDNAYGTGTGFLDENGKSVLDPNARSVGFDRAFSDSARPAIRKDLDDFVGLFAARYGMVLAKAFQRVPRPMLLLPIQSGPEMVYRALGPYVDGFWVRVPKTEDALRIYNAAHKPLVVSDALTADPDSPWYFKAKIDSIHFDAATGNTVIYAPELRYVFRTAQSVAFPDCAELMERGTCAEKFIDAFPRVKSAHWNVLAVPGDFTPAVKPGMRVEMWKQGKYPYACSTQAQRARDMVRRYQSLLDLQGDDGMNFVMGIEHWCLYDPAVSNWVDNENFGLATLQDNAYDGVEARQQTGLDARGYPVGGEETDYGNVIEELSAFLREVDNLLQRR